MTVKWEFIMDESTDNLNITEKPGGNKYTQHKTESESNEAFRINNEQKNIGNTGIFKHHH